MFSAHEYTNAQALTLTFSSQLEAFAARHACAQRHGVFETRSIQKTLVELPQRLQDTIVFNARDARQVGIAGNKMRNPFPTSSNLGIPRPFMQLCSALITRQKAKLVDSKMRNSLPHFSQTRSFLYSTCSRATPRSLHPINPDNCRRASAAASRVHLGFTTHLRRVPVSSSTTMRALYDTAHSVQRSSCATRRTWWV